MTTDPFLQSEAVYDAWSMGSQQERFLPFRGWRYAPRFPLEDVLSPPYDIIEQAAWAMYRQRHPFNIVHLVLPGGPLDGAEPDVSHYYRAAEHLHGWQRQKVLAREGRPALYVLKQTFETSGGVHVSRIGVIGRIALHSWGRGMLPHERTFPSAKADRLALLKATRVQFSPIFTLYSDPQAVVRSLLEEICAAPPHVSYRNEEGVVQRLWKVEEEDRIRALVRQLGSKTFYVADGHHRYETALNYQRWQRRRHPHAPPGQPYDYAMIYAAALEDPGVTILPTHRAVHRTSDVTPERVLSAVIRSYDVSPMQDDQELLAWIQHLTPGLPDIALVFPEGPAYRLHLRLDRPHVQQCRAETPPEIFDLAVYQLQKFVLGPGVGISDDPVMQKKQLHFSPDAEQLLRQVRAGLWKLVALVAPTSLEQFQALAEARQVAPPKATYFYPKLPSGLVMYEVGG